MADEGGGGWRRMPGASSLPKPSLSGVAFRRNAKLCVMRSFHKKQLHQPWFDPLGKAAMSAAVLPQMR